MDSSILRQGHILSREPMDVSTAYSNSFLSLSSDKQAIQPYDTELQNLRSKLQIETRQRHQLAERCDQLEAMLISQREDIMRLERCLRAVQSQMEQQQDLPHSKQSNERSTARPKALFQKKEVLGQAIAFWREPGFVLSLKHQGVHLESDFVDGYTSPIGSSPVLNDSSNDTQRTRKNALAPLNVNTIHLRDASKVGARLHQRSKSTVSLSPRRRVTFATSARSKIFEQSDSKLPDDSFCVPLQPADVEIASPGVCVSQLGDLSTSYPSQLSSDSEEEDALDKHDDHGLDDKIKPLFEECKRSCPGFAVKFVRLEKLAHENTLGISICSRIQNSNANTSSSLGHNTSGSSMNGSMLGNSNSHNDSDSADIGPYIVSIRAGGPAARSNKIKLEDQLLAVDDVDVRYMDTRDVITYLQETESVVHLIVARKKSKKHANGSSPQTML
eukprot:gene10479-2608_t